MKVLVVGNGGREHAIAWKLLQSPQVKQVFCAPGNGGTATLKNCQNLPYSVTDFVGLETAIQEHRIDWIAVGPEVPLSEGITDYFQSKNIPVFGPNKAGAKLEASKAWAKEIMLSAGVPTALSETFYDADSAKNYIQQQGAPIVIKADGLAAGKGVIVADTLETAINGVNNLFSQGFEKLVIEEFLQGEEVSILAFTDGKTILPLLPAQDHKRIGEGDTGENTGGMGVYAPAPIAPPSLVAEVTQTILYPTLKELQKRGIDYRGILYAGLMVSLDGKPKVLEFNCRFGDPETQAILPLLETSLADLMLACINQKLDQLPPIQWQNKSAVCVVIASGGYPDSYEKGKEITGLEAVKEAVVFHAGTKLSNNQLLTDGGRVLGITAVGDSFQTARNQVYQALTPVKFAGMYYRRDIGHRVLKKA